MAVLRGLKFSFLYFPQKLAEQVSCLFRQAIVTARGVVLVPLASLLQSKVQGQHWDVPTIHAQVLQPANKVRDRVAVEVSCLQAFLHGQARLEARCLHNGTPQVFDILAPRIGGILIDGTDIVLHFG